MFPIKANSVCDLSAGRYFATFAEWVGFCFDAAEPFAITPTTAQSISAWLSGPRLVAECGQMSITAINELMQAMPFDTIQIDNDLPFDQLSRNISTVIRRIVVQPTTSLEDITIIIAAQKPYVAHFLIDFATNALYWEQLGIDTQLLPQDVVHLCRQASVMLQFPFTEANILSIIEQCQPTAIAFESGMEEAVGIRLFDEIAVVIEQLDEAGY